MFILITLARPPVRLHTSLPSYQRYGTHTGIHVPLVDSASGVLPNEEVLIPQLLQKAGYSTHMVQYAGASATLELPPPPSTTPSRRSFCHRARVVLQSLLASLATFAALAIIRSIKRAVCRSCRCTSRVAFVPLYVVRSVGVSSVSRYSGVAHQMQTSLCLRLLPCTWQMYCVALEGF